VETAIHLWDDDESALRPTFAAARLPRVAHMKRWFYITLIAFGLLTLALGGWAVRGVRWTLTAPRRQRGRLAPA
jgi:hypothetical protein